MDQNPLEKARSKNKPWAILKVSRKKYCTARPWKSADMDRARFEEMLVLLPEGFVDQIHLESDAEKLIEAAFGQRL